MATSATLTSGSPTATLDCVAGSLYTIGARGSFNGTLVLETNLDQFDADFFAVEGGDFRQPFSKTIRPDGNKIKATLTASDVGGTSSVKISIVLAG